MKKTILTIALAAILASCGSKSKPIDQANNFPDLTAGDTAGLADYQNWKQQKEHLQEINLEGVEISPQNNTQTNTAEKPATRIVYRAASKSN